MQDQVKDSVSPRDRWEFDAEVTAAFDDMLARSIPQYDVMRAAVATLAARHAVPNTAIIDLGCSRGESLAPLVEKFGAFNRFVGVEVSQPMLAASRERFAGYIRAGVVAIRECDLRFAYPPELASVTLAVLTIQFTPIEYRQAILRRAYEHTIPGGCFVLVEKVIGSSASCDAALSESYYAIKSRNGYSQDQIERKKLSLEGVLVPVTASWNEELLRAAGFRQIECFWRWMNFAAWIAIRD